MKKAIGFKILAATLFLSLCVMAGGAWAETSTVSGAFIFDKTTISAGDKINISILGLDASGVVDRYGEQSGSTIIANVSSSLGTVKATGSNPENATSGSFAGSLAYVLLSQGVAMSYVEYGQEVSGTDDIVINLQEKYLTGAGSLYRNISSFTQRVTVNAATANVASLDIVKFTAPTSGEWKGDDTTPSNGIQGTMTAGKAGAQFVVQAYAKGSTTSLKSANGNVTLTFSPSSTSVLTNKASGSYSYTGVMVAGEATITLDDKLTAAGTYYVSASYGNLAAVVTSTPFIDGADTLTVYPDVASKLALGSDRTTLGGVSDATLSAANFLVSLNDTHGNRTTLKSDYETKINFSATNVDAIPLIIYVGKTYNSYNLTSDKLYSKNLSTVTAYASPKTGTALTNSENLSLTVVDKILGLKILGTMENTSGSTTTANASGKVFDVFYYNSAGTRTTFDSSTDVVVNHISSNTFSPIESMIEATTTQSSGGPGTLVTKFQKAADYSVSTWGSGPASFTVGVKGSTAYGYAYSNGLTVTTGSFSSAKLRNVNGDEISVLPVTYDSAGNAYTTSVYGKFITPYDAAGNAISWNNVNVTVKSDNATLAYTETSSQSTLWPKGNKNNLSGLGYATLTYDATKFTAGLTDTVTITATDAVTFESYSIKPTVTLPAASALSSLAMSISQTTIPLNGVVPVCVEAFDSNGNRVEDKTVTMSISGPVATLSAAVTPSVKQLTNGVFTTIISGQTVNFGSANTGVTGRNILQVTAPNQTGEFVITVTNAKGTITASKQFTVQGIAEQVTDIGQGTGPDQEYTEPATSLVNMYINTTNPEDETPVYEWFVFTAVMDGVQLPLYLLGGDPITIVAVLEGIDIYEYTYTYTSDVVLIAELAMEDLGLATGDIFAYGYAYQNEAGEILLPNVVLINIE